MKELDYERFIELVKKRRDRFHDNISVAVAWVERRFGFTEEFRILAFQRGLEELAREVLMRGERNQILRTAMGQSDYPIVVQVTQKDAPPPLHLSVSVTRSPLRDYPLATVRGTLRLEQATVGEVELAIDHIDQTMAGLARHRLVLDRVVAKARELDVEVIGELPDEALEECRNNLEEGDE